jgi:hypothetical protein
MPHPLDEYPIHQAPASLRHAATSDRNFYDRSYFNAHDRTGDIFVITGLGVYPHLGVIDAYASVGRGSEVVSVHASDALHDDRLDQRVGPYRIEVLEPLQKLRLVCDADEYGVGFDLIWEGSFPVVEEPRHIHRVGEAQILDAYRFAQLGTWQGSLRVQGTSIDVSSDRWLGTRDRSWGIRPVGEPLPATRWGTEGFWWLYVPLRFDDFAVIIILQEDPDGTRTLNTAKRVWPDGKVEELGWPTVSFTYKSGTRHPLHARITTTAGPVIEVDTLCSIPLGPGTGYSGSEWTHGQWKGPGWVEGVVHDWSTPALAGAMPFHLVDHAARATCDGAEGWGLFEHGSIGRHDPTGFADFTSVAP